MTLVDLDAVLEFLEKEAAGYSDGYECDEYYTEDLKRDLTDFLMHRNNWELKTAQNGEKYYEKKVKHDLL